MPSFRYSAFISYRHGQREIKHRFVNELHVALSNELELLQNTEVYVDWERLRGGDFYNETLAHALHQSACMIAVYQPNYFDLEHPYCAREFRGMCSLESHRLGLLPDGEPRNRSLIIPVFLRGEREIPKEIADRRQYEDFSRFTLIDEELSRHPLYAPRIRQIAEYIHERCEWLESIPAAFDGVEDFQLPSETETKTWLESVKLPRSRFPGTGVT